MAEEAPVAEAEQPVEETEAEEVVEAEDGGEVLTGIPLLKDVLWTVILQKRSSMESLLIFTISMIVMFEVVFEILGLVNGAPLTFLLTVPYLLWPVLWAGLVYLRSGPVRSSAPAKLVLQAFLGGLIGDVLFFVVQWISFLLIQIIVAVVYAYLIQDIDVVLLGYVALLLFYSFFIEALPEECFKYFVLSHICNVYGIHSKYAVVVYSTMVSLGFATFSGSVSVMLVYWAFGWVYALLNFFVQGLLMMTMHVVCGGWIAFGYMKRNLRNEATIRRTDRHERPLWQVLLMPFALHGTIAAFIAVVQLLVLAFDVSIYLILMILGLAFATLLVSIFSIAEKAAKLLKRPDTYESLLSLVDDEAEHSEEVEEEATA
mmetsp:Transcript_19314/g.74171  ORF Transcript_19314/g.74171 Transcript_19314/m.74171 type:complete len:373 (+) Transcript_19314:21-1139(+)